MTTTPPTTLLTHALGFVALGVVGEVCATVALLSAVKYARRRWRRARRTRRARAAAHTTFTRIARCERGGHSHPFVAGRYRPDLPCVHCQATVIYHHVPAAVASVLVHPLGPTGREQR